MMPVIAHNVLLVDADPDQRGERASQRAMRARHRGEPRHVRVLGRALGRAGDGARAADRLREGGGDQQASVKEGVLIRDLVRREGILPPDEVDEVLDLRKMTEIGVPGWTARVPLSRSPLR